MEILEQKSIITEMKNSLLGLKSRCEQAEDSVNLKWKKQTKTPEAQRPVGHHKIHQHMHNGSHIRRREGESKNI